MNGQLSRLAVALALSTVVAGCRSESAPPARQETARLSTPPGDTAGNSDAPLLADFNHRIDGYIQLRNKLKKDAPPLKETRDPAKIKESQDVLAAKIREARKEARQGDIFTPEIRQLLRRLMHPETKGREGAENKAIITEEKSELKDVVLAVNARYPDSAPLMTVPPDILAALPRLPEDLEYRFVSKHMILLDVHANLIVDYVLNAIR